MTPDWETVYHEVMEENLALAAIAGNLRNQLDAIREVAVTHREIVNGCRYALARDNSQTETERLVTVRSILGVNF